MIALGAPCSQNQSNDDNHQDKDRDYGHEDPDQGGHLDGLQWNVCRLNVPISAQTTLIFTNHKAGANLEYCLYFKLFDFANWKFLD